MTTVSRVVGHGVGALFIVLGTFFLLVGMNDSAVDWFDENATCESGDCPENSARATFLILGGSFLAVGVITSLGTELAVRKTQRLLKHVTDFQASGSMDSMEGLTEFLKPFGVEIERGANVNVEHRTIDLRGQRTGEVPTDPAGLSAYLKSMGVSLDEEVLRRATVVKDGEVISQGSAQVISSGVPAFAVPIRDEQRRETARIVGKRDRGSTAGNQRLIEFDLEVTPVGKAPYRVQVASLVRESLAGLLIEGATLNVRVDAADPNSVSIDWSEN